jgi:hypothetical protein
MVRPAQTTLYIACLLFQILFSIYYDLKYTIDVCVCAGVCVDYVRVYICRDLMYPDISSRINSIEDQYLAEILDLDKQAKSVYDSQGVASAVDLVTGYSTQTGNDLVKTWGSFFGELFVKYRDGYVFSDSPSSRSCGCSVSNGMYPQTW